MAFRLMQRSIKLCLIQIIMLTALRRDELTSGEGDLALDERMDMPNVTMTRQLTAVEALQRRGKGAPSGGGMKKMWEKLKVLMRLQDFFSGIAAAGAAVGTGLAVAPDWVPFIRRRRAEAKEEEKQDKPTPTPSPAPGPSSPESGSEPRRRRAYGHCLPHRSSCPTGDCCALGSSCNKCTEGNHAYNSKECRWKGLYVCTDKR
eukprot:TRINITY_DN6392_c2_g1_i2.p1 TRINITY_DN6392_c2_g1~~TRINITY_DN6392_c2_g1_i2.p1  ORF type:complete len:203 (-),score=18.04 TRINITY_DN6392_c2_g1_i2:92-700(-)